MGFGQTVGEQRIISALTAQLPRIAVGIERLAAAVEEHNRLAKTAHDDSRKESDAQ